MGRILLVLALMLVTRPLDAGTRLRKPSRGFQMKVGRYVIQPGADVEVCEYRRLPIRRAMDAGAFELRMPAGAHHFALWGYGGGLGDDAFPTAPVENVGCTGIARDDPFPRLLIPTQNPDTTLRFPPGVALRLEPGQQVFLNPHLKNTDGKPLTPDIRFNFIKAKRGTVRHYAQGLTFGNMTAIRIPPRGEQTITAEWTVPADITIVSLSTHQHQLGTFARIHLVAPDGGSVQTLVESRDWKHPVTRWWTDGLPLTSGRKLRITCTWRNTEEREVRFGPETTDEMCFAIGFFYRPTNDGGEITGAGCFPSDHGLLCPGAPTIAP